MTRFVVWILLSAVVVVGLTGCPPAPATYPHDKKDEGVHKSETPAKGKP